MSEEAVRQTRSQKRALEKDVVSPTSPGDKKVKLEGSDPAEGGTAGAGEGDGGPEKAEEGARVAASLLGSGEVKATIKVEVQTGDEPVDMSTYKSDIKSERQPPSPDDVIVLSDNEPPSPPVNGLNHCFKKTDTDKLMQSSPDERERFIQQLKEELRLQEARLVLLKKLRHSQTQKDTAAPKSTVATPPPLVRGSMTPGSRPLQVSSGRGSGGVIPPPLVRGGQHVPSKLNSQITMPPLVRGAQPLAVSPQQMHTLRQQQQQQQQHSGSGPPPLLLAPRATVPNVQVQGQKIIQQGLIRVANVPNTNVMVNIPQASPTNLKASPQPSSKESTASRQAAAKLALCKQLEKTLLEIPPPKPPAPELNFLPSAANNEFIYLVGLEEVVQNLLDTLGRGKQLGASSSSPSPKEPFSCSQCKTDFTSRWRKEKAGGVMCDQCMSSNQKKSLKAEHTNRLKAAFVKALQQEQEMEQRILQQAATSASAAAKSGSSPALAKSDQQAFVSQQYKQGRSQQQQQQHRASQPVVRHHSTIKQSPGQLSRSVQSAMGSRGVTHTFSTSSQLQNAVTTTAAALVSRPGKQAVRPAQGSKVSSSAAPASSWRKQTGGNTGVTMAYVNPSLSVHKSSSSAVDRQREYLLDMIPSRPLSQTANTWK